MTVQKRNSELVQLLTPDFQKRREPNFAWKSAISADMALPALRAFWPMSSVDYNVAAQPRDVSGGAYHLTNNNVAVFGYTNLIPYVEFVAASTQYLSRADGGAANWADITGLEAWIPATIRGLAIGGWFYLDLVNANSALMAKWDDSGVNQRSYMLFLRGANSRLEFHISSLGTAASTVICTGPIATTSQWYFIVGRFDPSTFVEIFVNGTWYQQAAAATASVFDSTASFTIGASSTPTYYMDGKASLCFLSACDMADAIVECFYAQTKAMFGVN